MRYRFLDVYSFQRKKHFEYFTSLDYPYVGVTINVNITPLLERVNES